MFHTNRPTYKTSTDIYKFYNVVGGVGRSAVAWPKHRKLSFLGLLAIDLLKVTKITV